MYQIFIMNTEPIFKRACELRGFEDKPNDLFYVSLSSEKMSDTWQAWYDLNTEISRFKSGELEKAVSEELDIPAPASSGFAVTEIDGDSLVISDLEETATCDLEDPSDAHMVEPITAFREWLANWNKEIVNQVMDTQEAAVMWGYSCADAVKRLCREGKVKCRKMTNGNFILDRNQPSPKMKRDS